MGTRKRQFEVARLLHESGPVFRVALIPEGEKY